MSGEAVEIAPGITVDRNVRFGKPVVKGTRVEVATVLAQLASGASEQQIARECGLTLDGILDALRYAAEIIADERTSGDERVELASGVTANRRVRFGKPVIQGTRVDVATLLGHLAAGDSIEAVAEAYGLTLENLHAALHYAEQVIASESVSAT